MNIDTVKNINSPSNARYFPTTNVRYAIILKNACSTIQATLLAGEGLEVEQLSVSEIHNATRNYPDHVEADAPLFVLLRDPYKRFISAFLDRVVISDFDATCLVLSTIAAVKLVRPDLSVLHERAVSELSSGKYEEAQKGVVQELNLRDISHIIALTPDSHTENHFKSQKWFLGDRHFDYMFSMENSGWQQEVEDLFGRSLVEARPHGTGHLTCSPGTYPDASQMSVKQLRDLIAETGSLPAAEDFLTPEVRKLITSRYRKDIELVASLQRS